MDRPKFIALWPAFPVMLACPLGGKACAYTSLLWHVKQDRERHTRFIGHYFFFHPSNRVCKHSIYNLGAYTLYYRYKLWPLSQKALMYKKNHLWALWPARGALIPSLSIPLFAFPPPSSSKRGSIHFSIWGNQVWIELTVVCQSFLALQLQICNLQQCLLGIFNSYINTGIVSCKYIICHCFPDSRYWLQPTSLDWRHTSFEKNDMYLCIFSFGLTFCNPNMERGKDLIPIRFFETNTCSPLASMHTHTET